MADLEIGNFTRSIDKRAGRGNTSTVAYAEAANMTSIAAKKTRLAAISGSTFTAARLNSMTENDMDYALKLHSADIASV